MKKVNIKRDKKTKNPASFSELTQERKEIIVNKLQSALLWALIKNGGKVILLKPQGENQTKA